MEAGHEAGRPDRPEPTLRQFGAVALAMTQVAPILVGGLLGAYLLLGLTLWLLVVAAGAGAVAVASFHWNDSRPGQIVLPVVVAVVSGVVRFVVDDGAIAMSVVTGFFFGGLPLLAGLVGRLARHRETTTAVEGEEAAPAVSSSPRWRGFVMGSAVILGYAGFCSAVFAFSEFRDAMSLEEDRTAAEAGRRSAEEASSEPATSSATTTTSTAPTVTTRPCLTVGPSQSDIRKGMEEAMSARGTGGCAVAAAEASLDGACHVQETRNGWLIGWSAEMASDHRRGEVIFRPDADAIAREAGSVREICSLGGVPSDRFECGRGQARVLEATDGSVVVALVRRSPDEEYNLIPRVLVPLWYEVGSYVGFLWPTGTAEKQAGNTLQYYAGLDGGLVARSDAPASAVFPTKKDIEELCGGARPGIKVSPTPTTTASVPPAPTTVAP